MFGWLFGKAATGLVEAVGTAVNKNIKTLKGDKAEVEAAIHDEQMASLAEHAAEFVSRPTRTKWDSFVDGLNRLPRPLIVLWTCVFFIWPFFDPDSFMQYVLSMELIPESLWLIFMTILGFFFGGRVLSQDIKPPRLSEEQRDYALKQIEKREKVILEARTPLIVEVAPTRKPPAPPWAREPADKPIIKKPEPAQIPEVGTRPQAIEKIIDEILVKEGGWANDPDDSGKATMYGITQATLSAWREKDCTPEEVRALSVEEARAIYRAEYWLKPGIDSLPIGLQSHVCDCGVSCGPRTGVKLFQTALNKLGAGIKEDGFVGPETREACKKYPEADIHNALADVRVKFYENLAARRSKDRKFLTGWKKRANSFRAK